MTRRTTTLLAVPALLLLGAAAYVNSFRDAFVFDDQVAIEENPAIRRLWPLGPILRGPRPVVDLTFAANYALGGLHVPGYHLVNLAVHLLAALTLFGILRRTLTLPALAGRFDENTAAWLGFCAALIWMLHPLQTEAVTYLAQRAESLMGLFYLLTLYSLIRAASSPRPAAWSVAAVAACALGMGCKQVMVTAPIALLLYDRCFIADSFGGALRRRGGLYLALAATWLILIPSSAAEAFGPHATSAGFRLREVTPFQYARSQPGVILHYLALALWPARLCLDYGWPVANSLEQIAPGATLIGGLLAATVWALVRRPRWGFVGAWLFLLLAPSSSIMPIKDLAFEHRMYLPLAAPAVAAVLALRFAAERLFRPRLALGITALATLCAAAGLGAMTLQRNAQYRSDVLIWEDAAAKRPRNPRAWSNLAEAYILASRYEQAIRCCDKALALDPNFYAAYYNRGFASAEIGRLPEAMSDYDKAIALRPDFAPAYNNRGIACARAGRLNEALRDYDEALRLRPDDAEAYTNRGNLYTQLGRPADAIREYDKAAALRPDFAEAYYNRAIADGRLGRWDEAILDCTKLLALNPGNAAAYNSRGKALANAHRPEDAVRDFDQAIALNPGYAEAYYNRGNAFDDANRNSEAVRDYDRAIALKPDYAEAYNNRGRAYLRSARFAEALRDFNASITLKPDCAGTYYNRAVADYQTKSYDKARADLKKFMQLGGKPDPEFLKALEQAAGAAK
jgi:tetratricopeptide (TPR) repeat protein